MRRKQHYLTLFPYQTVLRSIAIGLTILCTVTSLLALNTQAISAQGQQNVQCDSTYTVQAGDDLFQISLHFNVSIAALQSVNNISNANLIFAGQTLCIPAGSAAVPGTVTGAAPGVPANVANNNNVGDIGTEPPVDAIGNFLEICATCSANDIDATQLQFRQGQSICASVKLVPGDKALGWYRVNRQWCAWYPTF